MQLRCWLAAVTLIVAVVAALALSSGALSSPAGCTLSSSLFLSQLQSCSISGDGFSGLAGTLVARAPSCAAFSAPVIVSAPVAVSAPVTVSVPASGTSSCD